MKAIHSYLLSTAFAIGLLAQAASAQTATWNATSGNWSTAVDWNPPVDPDNLNFDVIFNNGGSLTLDASRNIGSYNQTGGTLTVVSGQSLVVWTGGSSSALDGGGVINLGYSYIYQGNTGNVVFTNTNGTIQGYGEIGFSGGFSLLNQPAGIIQANAPGQTLFLSGNGTFTNNGLMRALNGGRLTFNGGTGASFINNATIRSEDGSNVSFLYSKIVGGTLDNTGSTGTLTLDSGTLRDVTIAAGSTVTSGVAGHLETTLINHGTLTVAGGQSLLVASDTTLSGGGTIALGYGYIYANANNVTLTNTDNILRGYGEIGFAANNFSVVNASDGIIQADVSGQTLQLNGTITFTNNGLMRAQNGGALTFNGFAGTTVTNNGGTVQALTGSTIFGLQLALTQTAGTIDLNGGSMNFPLGVDLNGGQLIGSGTFTGPIRNNGGVVAPGHSAGSLAITGNYTQGATGALDIEIGGTTAGTEFDQLQVSGTVALDGTLNVTLIDGFRPVIGDVFQIITPNGFSGAFATINTIGFTGLVMGAAATVAAVWLFGSYPKLKVPSRADIDPASPDVRALVGRTELWLESQRRALPAPAVKLVDQIGLQLDALGEQLVGLDQASPQAVEVRKLVGQHLPEMIDGYQKIPEQLRHEERAGTTPAKQFVDGLQTISGEIDSVTRQLAAGALDNLAIKTRYLEYKYGDAANTDVIV